MKKILSVMLMFFLVLTIPVYVNGQSTTYFGEVQRLSESRSAEKEIIVTVNERKVEFDQEPVIIDGRTMVPIRKICDAIGAEIYWEGSDGMHAISIVKGNKLITMINGRYGPHDAIMGHWRINRYDISYAATDFTEIYNYYDEDDATLMEVEPVILNDRTCVPVRVISEYLGANVEWIPDERTVEITIENADFLRSRDEIVADEKFTYELAAEMYCNLPDVKGTEMEEMWGLYYCGFGFNVKGKVYIYCNDYGEYMYMYSDGTVIYADGAKNIIKEIRVEVAPLYASYKGVWRDSDSECPEMELIVKEVADTSLELEWHIYRIYSYDNITATIGEDGVIRFSDASEGLWGTMCLEENKIYFTVEKSKQSYIESQTIEFKWRSNESALK